MKSSDNYSYLESSKVQVFPCAYRGTNQDHGARLSTEYNLIKQQEITGRGDNSAASITSVKKSSYIISASASGTNRIINCVIGGYNFVLSFDSADITAAGGKLAYLNVDTKSGVDYNASSLTPWESSISSEIVDGTVNGTECFLALCFPNTATPSNPYATLAIFDNSGNIIESSLYANTYKDIESNLAGTPITGNLVNGTANGSITQLNNASTKNTASAKNAIALGEGTTADKENLVAIGKYNDTATGDLFVVGNGSQSTPSNILEVTGEQLKISGDLDVTETASFGEEVEINNDLSVVGALTVGSSGNETSIDLEGSLSATGNATIGSSAEDTSSDSAIKIGKTSTSANPCTTEILSNLKIDGNITDAVQINGNVTVGTSTVNKSTTLYGSLSTTGAVELGNGTWDSASSSAIKLGKTTDDTNYSTTEVLGKFKVDGYSDLSSGAEVTGGITGYGDISITGSAIIGTEAIDSGGSAIQLGQLSTYTDPCTTEVLGDLKVDGEAIIGSDAYDFSSSDYAIKIGKAASGSSKSTTNILGDLKVDGSITVASTNKKYMHHVKIVGMYSSSNNEKNLRIGINFITNSSTQITTLAELKTALTNAYDMICSLSTHNYYFEESYSASATTINRQIIFDIDFASATTLYWYIKDSSEATSSSSTAGVGSLTTLLNNFSSGTLTYTDTVTTIICE